MFEGNSQRQRGGARPYPFYLQGLHPRQVNTHYTWEQDHDAGENFHELISMCWVLFDSPDRVLRHNNPPVYGHPRTPPLQLRYDLSAFGIDWECCVVRELPFIFHVWNTLSHASGEIPHHATRTRAFVAALHMAICSLQPLSHLANNAFLFRKHT